MAVARLAQITGGCHNADGFDLTINATGADCVIVAVARLSSTSTGSTVAISGGGASFSEAGEAPAGDSSQVELFYLVGSWGGNITLNVRGSDNNWRGAGVATALSGVDAGSPLDAFPTGNSSAGSSTPSTGTFSAGASDFTLMFAGSRNTNGTTPAITARGTGQSSIGFIRADVGTGGICAWMDEGAAGDTAGDWTLNGSVGWSSAGIAVNASGGGGGATLAPFMGFMGVGF